ncbi:TetR/AcrR family transcriptional regulator [Deinococcus lacus]|uniref:TetR/AcrR family transcriptional regulator n=1 Tax=Deinococcus lacus TaxID=392561 RepID=A0ABW1YI88_9DEIO
MTPPPSPRRLSAAHRQDQILEMAARLFTEQGFEGVSVADIARALGTSRPTVYSYFPSTEAILDELFTRQLRDLPQRLFEHVRPGEVTDFSALFAALLQEKELVLLLHSGGGPQFRSRRRDFLGALEARLADHGLSLAQPKASHAQRYVLSTVLNLLTVMAYEEWHGTEGTETGRGERPELLGRFISAGLREVLPGAGS